MEDCEIREGVNEAIQGGRPQLEAIEINGSNCGGGLVIRWVGAVEAPVATNVPAHPCRGDPERVGCDGGLEFLDDGVDDGEALVRENNGRW